MIRGQITEIRLKYFLILCAFSVAAVVSNSDPTMEVCAVASLHFPRKDLGKV